MSSPVAMKKKTTTATTTVHRGSKTGVSELTSSSQSSLTSSYSSSSSSSQSSSSNNASPDPSSSLPITPKKTNSPAREAVISPRRKLRTDNVADSGAVPLWFQYTLPGSLTSPIGVSPTTKSYKHSLSGERRGSGDHGAGAGSGQNSPTKLPKNHTNEEDRTETDTKLKTLSPKTSLALVSSVVDSSTPPLSSTEGKPASMEKQTVTEISSSTTNSPAVSTPRPKTRKRGRTSQLAAAFLKKAEKSLEQDLRRCMKRVPSMQVVRSVKERWPPKTKATGSWLSSSGSDDDDDNKTNNLPLSQSRASHIKPSVPTKEILEKFESGSVHRSTSSSPPLSSINEDETSPDTTIPAVKKSNPVVDGLPIPDAELEAASSTPASTYQQKTPLPPPPTASPKLTSSSRTQALTRSSYKIQYVGGRSRPWNEGLNVDSSSPTIAHRRPDDDRRFDTDAAADVSLVIPRASHGLESSDRRFDTTQSDKDGAPLCFYPAGHDHRFDAIDTADKIVPSIRPHDGHFPDDVPPAMPRRSSGPVDDIDYEYIPTVWQTRISGSNNDDPRKRKWRLKRVWESAKDLTIIVNQNEPDYVVDEEDLEKALQTLLGVPDPISFENTLGPANDNTSRMPHNQPPATDNLSASLSRSNHTGSQTTMSSITASDLSSGEGGEGGRRNHHRAERGRQWHEHSRDRTPVMKDCCWRVQRVWDQNGVVIKTEAEQSMNGPSLMESLINDKSIPMDSLVWDFSARELVPSDQYDQYNPSKVDEPMMMSSLTEFVGSAYSEWSTVLNDAGDNEVKQATNGEIANEEESASLQPLDKDKEHSRDSISSDDASYIDDGSLDDGEFTASLGSFENPTGDNDNDESNDIGNGELTVSLGSFELERQSNSSRFSDLRKKLRKVEDDIKDMRNKKMAPGKKKKLYKELQDKCMHYLNELSEHLSEFEDQESHGPENNSAFQLLDEIPPELRAKPQAVLENQENDYDEDGDDDCDSRISIPNDFDDNDDDDDDDDDLSGNSGKSGSNHRDPKIVKRKLHKTERLIGRMVEKDGEKARTKKLYGRLHEKRAKYLQELGLEYEPLNFEPSGYQMESVQCHGDEDDLTDVSFSASMHSLLDCMGRLGVIEEEDDGSCGGRSVPFMVEESRSHAILRRKKRKVERKMRQILADRGPKAKKKSKLFRRYEAKLFQYCYELGESPRSFDDIGVQVEEKSPSSLSPLNNSLTKLRERVASALDVMESSLLDVSERQTQQYNRPDQPDHADESNKEQDERCQAPDGPSPHRESRSPENFNTVKIPSPKPRQPSPSTMKKTRWSPSSAVPRAIPNLPKTLTIGL
jgi:hypothetical protein